MFKRMEKKMVPKVGLQINENVLKFCHINLKTNSPLYVSIICLLVKFSDSFFLVQHKYVTEELSVGIPLGSPFQGVI